MAAWDRTKLGDIVETQKGYAFKSAWYCDAGRPIVKVSDFTYDAVDSAALECIPESTANEYLKYELKNGDVVLQTVGSWPTNPASVVGKCVRIPIDVAGALLNQNAVKLTPVGKFDKTFLFYLLRNEDFKTYIIGTAQGAASQAAITLEAIRGYEFELPPLPIQHRIAGILSAYDELIENSQRRIKILESIARGLYREWFVHFRFPGHESVPRVPSPLGEIPKGWEVRRLGEIAEEMRRNVAKGRLDEPQPYVGLEHIPRRSLALDAWKTTTDLGSNKLAFKKGEVLFGKIRPYFHKVSVAPFDGLCSADVIVVRARRLEYYAFVVACVSSDDFVAHATATSNGSKMPRANWGVLEERGVVIPQGKLAAQFSALIAEVIEQQQALVFQIQNLGRTRDLLLPRLLSGQVELN
jgi:type I restriction enzyme S subunit